MRFARQTSVPAAAGMCLAISAVLPFVRASVFLNSGKWPQNDAGYTIIPVCIAFGSSTMQEGSINGIESDPNPTLDDVVGRVRFALSRNWERYSSVRFVDFRPCVQLGEAEQKEAVGLYTHPTAPNNCMLGYHGARGQIVGSNACSFKTWGRSSQKCHAVDWERTPFTYEYRYDCAEQYAVHEVGHALGFLHEWNHPLTPLDCVNSTPEQGGSPASEQPLESSKTSGSFEDSFEATVVDSLNYDWNSIMVYQDKCADVNGVRFGGTGLSAVDIAGVREIYPPVPLGKYDVGVLLDNEWDCPHGKLVNIVLNHDEDNTHAHVDGDYWVGATVHSNETTHFKFCRVAGTQFGTLPKFDDTNTYSVLLLGESCPPDASPHFHTYHRGQNYDDEDVRNLYRGTSWMSGEYGPTESTPGGGTSLHFCLFKESADPSMPNATFPDFGYRYGVFAGGRFESAEASSWNIYYNNTDGDTTHSHGDYIGGVDNETTSDNGTSIHGTPAFNSDDSSNITQGEYDGETGRDNDTIVPTDTPTLKPDDNSNNTQEEYADGIYNETSRDNTTYLPAGITTSKASQTFGRKVALTMSQLLWMFLL